MVNTATDKTFNDLVINNKKPVLVDFFAPWCGPCKIMEPVIEQMAGEREDVAFVKVNVDASPDLAMQYNVASIPTIVVFKDGAPIAQSIGAVGRSQLDALIAKGK